MKKFVPLQVFPLAAAAMVCASACCMGITRSVPEEPELPPVVQLPAQTEISDLEIAKPTKPVPTEPAPTKVKLKKTKPTRPKPLKPEATRPEGTEAIETDPQDVTPPVISGVTDKLVYTGGTVAYRIGVTVTDDMDPAPQLKIFNKDVDLNVPGEYIVIYLAQDAAGNETKVMSTITVKEMEEDYASPEEVKEKVADLLAKIIKPGMDTVEQCRAIYRYMHGPFGYKRNTPIIDVYQSANEFLKTRTGNCYSYFSLCKLMFDQLGIPNIDVHKERRSDDESEHYWNLVSPDGGKSWYHFDATPRAGAAPSFCLVTDALLDRYSNTHNGSHNRNKSLYPATPEKELPGTVTAYLPAPTTTPTTEPTTEVTTEAPTEATTEATTEAPTEATTEAPTESAPPATEAPAPPETEAPPPPETEAPPPPATEAPPPPETEAPAPPATEAPPPPATEAPAPPPAEAPAETTVG